jgi:hypothetical protein
MRDLLKSNPIAQIIVTSFVLLTVWWLVLQRIAEPGSYSTYLYGAVYGPFMTVFGGLFGLYSAKIWGSWKSMMGKAVIMLSCGLLAQALGQISNSVFNLILGIEVSYPGIPDIGFFGSVPIYIYALWLLAKASGVKINSRSWHTQLQAVIIPAIGLISSYYLFLQVYEFDWTQPLTIALDFGYPLGQALYVSLAILVYSLSRKSLGGVMKNPIQFLIASLVVQYLSDFAFLYANSHNGYFVGGTVDYLYLIAYTLMTLGLIQLHRIGKTLHSMK